MKRCSKCEFIYEDDQRFCDMDGTELAIDPGPFQFSQEVAAPTVVAASRLLRFLRSPFSLAALALVGVLLSALVIGYYDSVREAGSTAENRKSVGSLVPSAQAETTETPTSGEEITEAEGSATAARPLSVSGTGARGASPTSNSTASKRRAGRGSQAGEPKKESKVTKMFRKTGRFLTKPFKKL